MASRKNVVVKVYDIDTGELNFSRRVDFNLTETREWLCRTVNWAAGEGKLVQTYAVADEAKVNSEGTGQ